MKNQLEALAGVETLETLWPGYLTARIEERIVTTESDAGSTETYSYVDMLGNTVGSLSGGNQWNFNIFDAEGRAVLTVSGTGEGGGVGGAALAAKTWNVYDSAGLLVRTGTTDSSGTLTVTDYKYDAAGRLVETRRGGVVISLTTYSVENGARREETTGSSGARTIRITNGAGQLVSETVITAAGEERVTTYAYDGNGRRWRVTDPRGLVTDSSYDQAGREISTTRRAGGREFVERRGYDRYGRAAWTQTEQQAETDGTSGTSGTYTTYLYKTDTNNSSEDDTISILDDVISVNDPSYGQLVAVYYEDDDKFGTNNDDNGTDLYSGMYEWYQYDERGRQIVVQKPVYKNANEPRVNVQFRQVFNDEGRVEYAIFNYDYYLNNWSETNYNDTPTTNVTFRFTYKSDGSRDKVIYPSGMEKDFDDFAAETGFTENPVEPSDITRTYNQEGLLKSRTAVDIGTINYGYDQFGSLASMSYFGHTVSYDYDFFGRLKTARDPKAQWNYSYNKLGLKELVTNDETGMREEYEYDALGRVENLTHRRADDSIEFEADYQLGVDGNRIGIAETRDTSIVNWDFEYDELGRLGRETRDGGFARDVSYTYDVDSNRKTETDHLNNWAKEYFYYPDSQRLQQIKKNNILFESYTWHDGGQLQTKTEHETNTITNYTWNGEKPVLIEDNKGLKIEFFYDSEGHLIAKKVHQDGNLIKQEKYLQDTNNLTGYSQIVCVLDGESNQVIKYNTFAEEIKSQSPANNSNPFYLHSDALGSIRSLTVKSGNSEIQTVEQYNYTAFGSYHSPSFTVPLTDYAFTGQLADANKKLQFHRLRLFDPQLGRWNSEDYYFDFPSNQGNIYNYTGQSPLKYIDPSGGYSLLDVVSTVAIIGGLYAIDLGFGIGILKQRGSDAAKFSDLLIKIHGAILFELTSELPVIGSAIAGYYLLQFLVIMIPRIFELTIKNPAAAFVVLAGVAIVIITWILVPRASKHLGDEIAQASVRFANRAEDVHDPVKLRRAADEAFGGIRVTDPTGKSNWWIEYKPLEHLGDGTSRATGVKAKLNKDLIENIKNVGSEVSPGFREQLPNNAGHLLARIFGGKGDMPENLVRIHRYANNPLMTRIERTIRTAVRNDEIIEIEVIPHYFGNTKDIRGITIIANGNKGTRINQTIRNVDSDLRPAF